MNQNIIEDNSFDFASSAIIKPPSYNDQDVSMSKKYITFVVDSRDRNVSSYPDPSQYVIEIDDEIQDVAAVELMVARVPLKMYIVDKSNNTLHITINNVRYKLSIPYGDYRPIQLSIKLTEILNTLLNSVAMHVAYNDITDKFIFYGQNQFTLHFNEVSHCANKLLGFRKNDYTSDIDDSNTFASMQQIITPPYRKNFDDNSYVVLNIRGFNINQSQNQSIDRSFVLVPSLRSEQNIVTETHVVRKDLNPPIARLTKLHVSFTTRNGEIVDFQNHDHYFILRFECFRQSRKYTSYIA